MELQNAQSDFTHEVHSKISTEFQADYAMAIANIATNLAVEDRSDLVVRDILQKHAEKKEFDDFTKD